MKYYRAALVAAAALAAACDRETGPTDPNLAPVAFVRYVHAVVDTGATDWRPIDRLEDSPSGIAIAFRAFTSYQGMGVWARHLRIFPTTTNINQTSAHLIDMTITFAQDTYYTLVHVGNARGGTDRLLVIEDDNSAPPAGQV